MVWNKHVWSRPTHLRSQFWMIPQNVSNLSMQVYPLLESVKDNMVASTIRKGDTLRIQVGGRAKTETRFVCDMCQIREGTEIFTQKMCSDAYCLKKNCITICNYAVCLEVFLAQMFRVLFFATTHSFNQPLVGVDELWRMSFPWLPFGYHCPRTSFDPNGCRMKRWHPFNAMISHRTIWELKW